MIEKTLNGKWQMKQATWDKWIKADVPGDVYNDLLNANLIDDPFYRENEYDATKLSYDDYEYRTSFEVDKHLLSSEKVLLCCNGQIGRAHV